MPAPDQPAPKRHSWPVVIRQPWGDEYACCGGHPDRGHVGRCGS